MKKAVITTGGKQYLVSEGDEFNVELISSKDNKLSFEPLLTIDGDKVTVGKPTVDGSKVSAEIIEAQLKADKVTAIRYKAKKRVRKVHGHRQNLTKIKITKIS
ncbi:50S ribosomal protein L21 [Candidatus Saccharibacteria bacterium RIFCSPHIGHO2_02_FULL_47_12]|nr:MAG: 50S ribosomal protein L21 [Candidatus Saccharibacteria bacterium RIFCSPHIGHO2_02_FULL_47_12]